MRPLTRLLTLLLFSITVEYVTAQTIESGRNSISVQPVLWLDNLVPREVTGLSIQFETSIAKVEAPSGFELLFSMWLQAT